MKPEKTLNHQRVLRKNKAGDINFLILSCAIKPQSSKWYGTDIKQIDQRNRIESPGINPSKYGQTIFHKGAKSTLWRKGSHLINGAGINGYSHVKE